MNNEIVSVDLAVNDDKVSEYLSIIPADSMLEIDTQDEYELAAALRIDVNRFVKDMDERRAADKAPSLAEGRRIDGYWMPPIKKLQDFLKLKLDPALLRYQAACRKRQQEAEALAQAERERLQWEALELMKDHDDPLAQETADDLLRAAEATRAPVVTIEKVDDLGSRSNWKYRVVNPDLFYKTASHEWKLPNESALNAEARRTEGKTVIPGCEAYDDRSITSRR